MIAVHTPSDPTSPTLADLSRNASVISTSSSDSSPSLVPPPRPIRTFNSPRSRSPQVTSSRVYKPPAYLARAMGRPDLDDSPPPDARLSGSRARSGGQSKPRNGSANTRVDARDFEFLETLGEGSYSTVKRARYIATEKEYAIKMLDKGHLLRHNKLETALAEKNALVKLGTGHPGVVRLYWAFHDEWRLYFVIDLARNGEMQSLISRLGSLSTECAQYYGAQIVDALEYTHSAGVIHRDLKPENLLLDDAFRIKIADFGTAKCLEPGEERAKTFVGTAQYVSPELLEASETSKSSDLWALGCIIYQMIAGRFAFQGLSEYLTWQKIKKLEFSFAEGFDEDAKDLVQKLLVRDPAQRLGAGLPGSPHDMKALRAHPFFSSIDWITLWTGPAPPLEPGLVKREIVSRKDANAMWEDVGANWDEIVTREGLADDDEIPWAEDTEDPTIPANRREKGDEVLECSYEEEGPLGEIRRFNVTTDIRVEEEDTATLVGHSIGAAPIPVRPTNGNASGSSSSDGSPTDSLGARLDSVVLDRGRNRAQTPVQGNFQLSDVDLPSGSFPGENILYTSRVEARSLKRRASMLLPLSVTTMKPKMRILVLTTHRILCVKHQTKGGKSIVVKVECLLYTPEKSKEKESRAVVTGIQTKGDRELVLQTAGKSFSFIAEGPIVASTWVRKINEALARDTTTSVTQSFATL